MAKCLIVDDDLDLGETLSSILDEEGYKVQIASDGREGLKKISEEIPDIVLLDVEMPVLNGPDMAYELFAQDCGKELIPIVLLSGVSNLKQVAEQVGTPYFLAKPYPLDQLLHLIQQALAEKRSPVPLMRGQT